MGHGTNMSVGFTHVPYSGPLHIGRNTAIPMFGVGYQTLSCNLSGTGTTVCASSRGPLVAARQIHNSFHQFLQPIDQRLYSLPLAYSLELDSQIYVPARRSGIVYSFPWGGTKLVWKDHATSSPNVDTEENSVGVGVEQSDEHLRVGGDVNFVDLAVGPRYG